MRPFRLGRTLFAVGLAGLGVLSLGSGDFALNWQPVPEWVPAREILARASGLLLLTAGAGILIRRTAGVCAFLMAAYMLSWVLLLQVPRVVRAPGDLGMWLGLSESLWLFCGGWIITVTLSPRNWLSERFPGGPRIARLLFAFACLVLGLSHFVFLDATVSMIPAWLPARVGFAYVTGAGHFATGLALFSRVLQRLAATMEACMICVFVLLVHLPGVMAAPGSRLQWTMLYVASALAGSAWVVAGTLRDAAWGWTRLPVAAPLEKTEAA